MKIENGMLDGIKNYGLRKEAEKALRTLAMVEVLQGHENDHQWFASDEVAEKLVEAGVYNRTTPLGTVKAAVSNKLNHMGGVERNFATGSATGTVMLNGNVPITVSVRVKRSLHRFR